MVLAGDRHLDVVGAARRVLVVVVDSTHVGDPVLFSTLYESACALATYIVMMRRIWRVAVRRWRIGCSPWVVVRWTVARIWVWWWITSIISLRPARRRPLRVVIATIWIFCVLARRFLPWWLLRPRWIVAATIWIIWWRVLASLAFLLFSHLDGSCADLCWRLFFLLLGSGPVPGPVNGL